MSWAQLRDQIRAMTPEEQLQPVRFFDGTDDGLAVEVSFARSEREETYGEGEEAVTIRKGEGFLW